MLLSLCLNLESHGDPLFSVSIELRLQKYIYYWTSDGDGRGLAQKAQQQPLYLEIWGVWVSELTGVGPVCEFNTLVKVPERF